MRVTHISRWDRLGGAATAAWRLHSGLVRAGVASRMLVRDAHHTDLDGRIDSFRAPQSLADKVERVARRARLAGERLVWGAFTGPEKRFISDLRSRYRAQPFGQISGADVLNLHWATEFVDVPAMLRSTTMPIVWTLHDMNAFTGGCHCAMDCRRFEYECGKCPYLGAKRDNDLSRRYFAVKRAAYRELSANSVTFVTPSRWLSSEAESSALLRDADIRWIPNGIDTSVFRPVAKNAARRALCLSDDSFVMLFISDGPEQPWKGLDQIERVIDELKDEPWLVPISIGSRPARNHRHPNYRHIGAISDESCLAGIYSAADVMCVFSRQDNFPNTVIEAMSCERPVMATDVGGIAEAVRDRENGWLVDATQPGEIANLVRQLHLTRDVCEQLGRAARQRVVDAFTLEQQSQAYMRLYHELCDMSFASDSNG